MLMSVSLHIASNLQQSGEARMTQRPCRCACGQLAVVCGCCCARVLTVLRVIVLNAMRTGHKDGPRKGCARGKVCVVIRRLLLRVYDKGEGQTRRVCERTHEMWSNSPFSLSVSSTLSVLPTYGNIAGMSCRCRQEAETRRRQWPSPLMVVCTATETTHRAYMCVCSSR